MNYPQFWLNASPKLKRFYSTGFILILAVLATVAGMFIQLPPQEAQAIYDQLNQTTTSPGLLQNIFVNNFPLCLLMFIPLAGLGIGLFILFSTGIAFRAVFDVQAASGLTSSAAASDLTASTAILMLIAVGAVFVLEYVSYTIAMTESVWLFRRILQKRWGEFKIVAALIGLTALLLIIGAVVEAFTITASL